MFVNRETELKALENYGNLIEQGERINIAIFGLRRIGKTQILLKFKSELRDKKIVAPYINLHSIIVDKPSLVFHILKETLFEITGKKALTQILRFTYRNLF